LVHLFNLYWIACVFGLCETHLGAPGFANDAPETLRYGSIVKRARVGLTHASDYVPFSLTIAYWQAGVLLCSSSFDGQLRPAVEQVKQLTVDGVDQHSPDIDAPQIVQFMILAGSRQS
jgi:hypothetical protein